MPSTTPLIVTGFDLPILDYLRKNFHTLIERQYPIEEGACVEAVKQKRKEVEEEIMQQFTQVYNECGGDLLVFMDKIQERRRLEQLNN